MSSDARTRTDARLDQAAAALGYADPRPALRERMRLLKESHPEAFERARRHYEEVVLGALAEAANPLAAWIEYAQFLAALTAPGRMTAIDASGRAAPYREPEAGLLVLHIPDDTAQPVLVAAAPAAPSPAQQAALDLLVNRKLSL